MSKSFSGFFFGTGGDTVTIWDNITKTQPNYDGTELPRSFIIQTENHSFWVHGNATKHMAEYILSQLESGHSSQDAKLAVQIMLFDMQKSLEAVTKDGISYGIILHHGNWEFIIRKPKNGSPYDAVIHALIRK